MISSQVMWVIVSQIAPNFDVTQAEFLAELDRCRLIASVQTERGSPLDSPESLLRLAECSLREGVRVLRLEGIPTIELVRARTDAVVIGLIKRQYQGSDIYITPTLAEVDALIETGCEVIALDARPSPELQSLIERIVNAGRLVLADCDSVETARAVVALGLPVMISSTLCGYTGGPVPLGPDLDFVASVQEFGVPVLAEGRYSDEREIAHALALGAACVVIGGALNDPVKQTRRFIGATRGPRRVGAVDIGGTNLRFAVYEPGPIMVQREWTALPTSPLDRIDWIKERLAKHPVEALGVASGGVISSATGRVTESNEIIPGHTGLEFSEAVFGVPTYAINDGLAAALAHAYVPELRGLAVLSLAIGTGLGCGMVVDGKLVTNAKGDYPRWNEQSYTLNGETRTFEQWLGGAYWPKVCSGEEIELRRQAFAMLISQILKIHQPDVIVVSGSVGLSPELNLISAEGKVICTPLEDPALLGAAWLAWLS